MKCAWNANRSVALRARRRRARSVGKSSQDPCASMTRPVRRRSRVDDSAPRSSQCQAPASPTMACTAQGWNRLAPAARACSSSRPSSVSRPRARPHAKRPSPAGGRSAVTARSARISVTRRNSGPASAITESATPSSCNKGRLLAAIHSPHTVRLGNACCSTSATDQPARASNSAAVAPAGPAPMTTASNDVAVGSVTLHPGRARR